MNPEDQSPRGSRTSDDEEACEPIAPRSSMIVRAARVLLVVALALGVSSVWRASLEGGRSSEDQAEAMRTHLRIVRRVPDGAGVDQDLIAAEDTAGGRSVDAIVELYSIDTVAAERDYRSERRAGMRFDDFLRERSGRRPPLAAEFDESNHAALRVAPGRWWIHARHTNGEAEWTWRVSVNVTGREQTIELTPENVYTRSQSY